MQNGETCCQSGNKFKYFLYYSKVQISDGNLEAQARQARYQAYQQHLQQNEILLLAHHQQDQAETAILRLLSGTGVDGLAAMQAIDYRENMTIWRPFWI